ncbi:hypothetical protein PF010_g9787 [Phytophthora fragariae]|uniref:Uncharacterized protein n=1 Tax=Phytophthora fragariae TaxID=53985 RepID=A0A6A3ZJQ0_9STRA|nr:hypothetical protein PF010_g9787 [Phytophthora fragariae]KAE9236203.1 hypothetical protein PF002_g11292 [Phytophthora fragariae]
MAFLADDEMAAFEAVLSFVDEFADGSNAAPLPAQPGEVLNKQEMEWALTFPPANKGSPSSSSVASPPQNAAFVSSPASNHHTTTDEDGSPRREQREQIKRTRAPRRPTAKKLLRKSWVTGDSNRARNERRIEVAYLKEKPTQGCQEHAGAAAQTSKEPAYGMRSNSVVRHDRFRGRSHGELPFGPRRF